MAIFLQKVNQVEQSEAILIN